MSDEQAVNNNEAIRLGVLEHQVAKLEGQKPPSQAATLVTMIVCVAALFVVGFFFIRDLNQFERRMEEHVHHQWYVESEYRADHRRINEIDARVSRIEKVLKQRGIGDVGTGTTGEAQK